MSVIGSLSVTPNRIGNVYRYVRYWGTNGVTPDELEKALSPLNLRGATKSADAVRDVVNEAKRLGIIKLDPDERYRLTPGVQNLDDSGFLAWLEKVLLDIDSASEADQREFPYALAWLLEQDLETPFDFGDNIRNLIESQYGPDVQAFQLTNRARSQNFVYWAQYLGYAWRLKLGDREVIMPDPTRALQRHLPDLFLGTQWLPIQEFVKRWAVRCPVVDGGIVRQEMLSLRQAGVQRDPLLLSPSTSLALFRLEERGIIKLEQRADALTLTLSSRPTLSPVSHVLRLGGN